MNNKIFIAIIVAAVAILGIIFIFGRSDTAQAPVQNAEQSGEQESMNAEGDEEAGMFTMEEVAMHKSEDDCYAVINGSVYDLTDWIANHPGGPQAILSLCGTDGTARFENQHGGFAQAIETLATFKIGELQE